MKISVIIPAYNAQKSISRLIESLLSQTLKEFEILLIDDGSTDGTAGICDEYASKHIQLPTIKVFHKKNEGVAMARQLGIDNACGEYSIHADTDDWVEPTMLEEMYNKAKAEKADIIIADFFTNDTNIVKQEPTSLDGPVIVKDILSGKLFGSLWNKLLLTEMYRKHKACFFPGVNFCEDVLIWAQILQHDHIRIAYLNKSYYHYMMNSSSITHNFTRKSYDMLCMYYTKLKDILQSKYYEHELRKVRLRILSEAFMHNILSYTEVWYQLMKRNKYAAFCNTTSPRWWLGYLCMALGLFPLAKKALSYN